MAEEQKPTNPRLELERKKTAIGIEIAKLGLHKREIEVAYNEQVAEIRTKIEELYAAQKTVKDAIGELDRQTREAAEGK